METVINIGSRREVFWDDYLVDTAATTATRLLHHPEFAGTVLTHDSPWEGDGCTYHNIVADEGLYRMYYSAAAIGHADPSTNPPFPKSKGRRICYAESRDGLTWTKPSLGLRTFEGSTDNNIILDAESVGGPWDNFMVFKDSNPACPPDELYKGVGFLKAPPVPGPVQPVADFSKHPELRIHDALWCFLSADGIRFRPGWRLLTRDETGSGYAFDTLNVAFWDPLLQSYRLYIRGYHRNDAERDGNVSVRDIRYSTSTDFRTWTKPQILDFGGAEDYPLYTNVIMPYERAPHLSIGFPTRYVERREWTPNYDRLPDPRNRRWRMEHGEPRYGLAVTDCVFMCSRDGLRFHREEEAFLRPGPEGTGNWVYGDCYPGRMLIETPARRGCDPEFSIYLKEGYWQGKASRLDRLCMRLDGFVSRHATYETQRVVTKPLVFAGDELRINFSTSARGHVFVTIRDEAGRKAVSYELFGDATDRVVDFAEGTAADFAGRPVVLEFEMSDADLYALRFATRA